MDGVSGLAAGEEGHPETQRPEARAADSVPWAGERPMESRMRENLTSGSGRGWRKHDLSRSCKRECLCAASLLHSLPQYRHSDREVVRTPAARTMGIAVTATIP